MNDFTFVINKLFLCDVTLDMTKTAFALLPSIVLTKYEIEIPNYNLISNNHVGTR